MHRKLCKVYSGAFKCQRCSKKFATLQEMVAHREKEHVGDWPCTECQPQRIFENFARFCSHKKNVHTMKTCHCGIQYRPADYEKHVKICNNKKPDGHKCPICNEEFDNKTEMLQHRDEVHVNMPCEECGKVFSTYAKLRDHGMLHKYRPCQYCGKEISHAYYNEHIKICSVDVSDKKHACDKCPFKSHSIVQLKQHRTRYHRSGTTGHWMDDIEVDEDGEMKCPKCSLRMSVKGYVFHHKSVHGGLPPKYPSNLINQCEKCSEVFTTKRNLDKHLRTVHFGEPVVKIPYVPCTERVNCEYCGKSLQKRRYYLHVRRQHPKKD
jgi:DNA-directed RNA polymerase subunit RPC12/RpoP